MYKAGVRLPPERASKLGHLDVLRSKLVTKLIEQFEYPEGNSEETVAPMWQPFPTEVTPLRIIFSVDGSLSVVKSEGLPKRELAFIKTALLRIDPNSLAKLDREYPNPFALRKIMSDSALYHSTVLPLKGVRIPGDENLNGVRQIINDSFLDPRLDGEVYQTLKWLLYEKWSTAQVESPHFDCPHCGDEIPGLLFDSDESVCSGCGGHLFVTDVIGFHLEMMEDSASQGLASAYMLVHEVLLLFTAIRYFWTENRKQLSEILFIKDGPLTLRSQYSKLVPGIRRFLQAARDQDIQVHVMGQEKTGVFVEYLSTIARYALPQHEGDSSHFAVLSHGYIRREIQRTPNRLNDYGLRTNYGEKTFVKIDPYHSMVISVPCGEYHGDEDFPNSAENLIGYDRILATLPGLISHRFENALVPIELANGVASLSSYPSAKVLQIFAGFE